MRVGPPPRTPPVRPGLHVLVPVEKGIPTSNRFEVPRNQAPPSSRPSPQLEAVLAAVDEAASSSAVKVEPQAAPSAPDASAPSDRPNPPVVDLTA